MENTQEINNNAIDIITNGIMQSIQKYMCTLSYDLTKRGIIKKVLVDNNYSVLVQGSYYTLPSAVNMKFSLNNIVWVTFPQNNLKDGYISGIAR